MRKVPVNSINDTMILGRTIIGPDNNILLNAGMKLRDSYAARFLQLGIYEVYIDDRISTDINIEDVISEETRFEARVNIKKVMDSTKFDSKIDTKPVRESVNRMIDELTSNKNIVINLQDLKSKDQYTYSHSVNVCVLSIVTGIGLNLIRAS